jgi:tetrapyrrole methylase family protein/MazG family protein
MEKGNGPSLPLVHVVGLGPAGADLITDQSMCLLKSGLPLFLRTARHPAADDLAAAGIAFRSFDHLYEESPGLEEAYESMAARLAEEARACGETIYAVPGNPRVAEESVELLLRRGDVRVKLYPGLSFLDLLFPAVGLDPVEGVLLADAAEIAYRGTGRLEPRLGLVVMQADSRMLASDLKLSLLELYPPEHLVQVCSRLGGPQQAVTGVPLARLDHQELFDHLTTLYLPPLREEEIFDFKRLMHITGTLLGPQGCPWDRRQTHGSLARHMVEESWEAVEAIREEDWEHLAEELGDILLQVALHSQMARRDGLFGVEDCLRSIEEKLIRRHPHVFGEGTAETPEEVVANWERIKTDEGGHPSLLDGVAEGLPALLFAYKLQTRAARVGFDWGAAEEVLPKLAEELEEIKAAVLGRDELGRDELELELGDLLFTVANICRHLGVDPEVALRRSAGKFRRRFRALEELCRGQGLRLEEMGLEELDRLWERCKEGRDA